MITAWTVYPTDEGTFVWMRDAAHWEGVVNKLTDSLGEQGIGGTVTAPSLLDVWEMLNRNAPQPATQLAFPLVPGIDEGPVNVWGRPAFRWGVLGETTEKVLAESVDWAGRVGSVGVVGGGGPTLPASARDAGDLIRMRLADGQKDVSCTFVSDRDNGRDRARLVQLDTWGQVVYSDIDPTRDPTELAEDLAALLVKNAASIEYGTVALVRPNTPGWRQLKHGGRWSKNRHLWSTRAHDAHGIQVLTSAHLSHARDLSKWRVSEVATDRYLVQAESLAPWYATPDSETWKRGLFPSIDTLAQARHDFGQMILTEEVADANPLQMITTSEGR